MKNYYETLGLEAGASKEEIEKRYKQLSEELNPANNDNQEFFKEEFEKVQEAYQVLIKDALLSKSKLGDKLNSNLESIDKNIVDNDNEDLNNKPSSFLSKQNLILLLLIILIGHNLFLQTKLVFENNNEDLKSIILEASANARRAASYASDASDYASDAADYASDAADNASDAADYASDAADNARDAYYEAQNANYNSFGYQCYSCP